MSLPRLLLRARSSIGAMALVSLLHTSAAAYAQAPAAAPPTPPPPASAGAPSAAAPHAAASPGAAAPAGTPPHTASPANAPATDDAANVRDRARAAYSAGQSAYAAGQYAAAEAHFGLADSLLPAVQAKYWRAMSLDQLGNVPGALAAFDLVLASGDSTQLGSDKLANAGARRSALAATPAELRLTTTPSGARVNVSGVDLRAPTPLTLKLAPGRHLVRVVLDGYEPQQLELNVSAGDKLTPNLSLVPSANPVTTGALPVPALSAPPADAAPASVARSPVPGIVTLGIAGASAIVGTIFGIKALNDKQEYDDGPTTRRADDVERNALISDMAFGVTLTLGITGVVLLVAEDAAPEAQVAALTPSRLQVTPYVAPSGAGASATLTF